MVSLLKRFAFFIIVCPALFAQANLPSGTTATGYIQFSNIAAPSTPASGKTRVFADSTLKVLCSKNDAGTTFCGLVYDTSGTSHQFVTSIIGGVIARAQPGFSDLSGSASCSQMPALTGDATSSAGSCATSVSALHLTGPTTCAAGQYAQGIDSSGNATGCTAVSGGGSGSVNNPSNVPVAASPNIPYNGMFLWVSADCITLSDGSTCAVPSNGTTISIWYDRSGNYHGAVRSSGTCTFNTSQINGQPAVNFAGSCAMTFNGFNYFAGSMTIFTVAKATSTGAARVIVSGENNAVEYDTDGVKQQRLASANIASLGTGTAALNTSWHQMNVSCDYASNPVFRLDRASDATIGGSNCSFPVSSGSGKTFSLGYLGANGCCIWSGQIAEFIFYNRLLSSTEITNVETYLNSKYGL